MALRRALYPVLFVAVVVLPLWLVIGSGLFGGDLDAGFLVSVVLAPLMFVGLGLVTALTVARRSVRAAKALSWADVAVLVPVWASLVVAGALPRVDGLIVLPITLVAAAFWLQLWRLIRETRRRVRDTLDAFDRMARTGAGSVPRPVRPDVIVIDPPARDR